MAQEGEVASHAIASDRVRIVDDVLQGGEIDKTLAQSEVCVLRNGERLARPGSLTGEGGVDEL
jgi:hypothetical protein